MCGERKDGNPKPIRFFYMWTEHKDFLNVAKEVWNNPIHGDPLFIVVQKLKAVKMKLKKWNIEVYGRVDVNTLRKEMFKIQDARRRIPRQLSQDGKGDNPRIFQISSSRGKYAKTKIQGAIG